MSAWTDLPAWFPPRGEFAGFARTPIDRALAAGLRIRPLATTIGDMLAWHLRRPEVERARLRAGLAPDREAEVRAAWRRHLAERS